MAERTPLAEDATMPVTFTEALSVAAMRQALFENLQLADSLNATSREKLGVHALGMLLSVCAGCVNAIAFIKFKTYVSHVSGVSTSIGLRFEGEQDGPVFDSFEILVYFILGATLGGLIIPKATLKMGQPATRWCCSWWPPWSSCAGGTSFVTRRCWPRPWASRTP